MKKALSICLALVLLAGALSGCGGRSAGPESGGAEPLPAATEAVNHLHDWIEAGCTEPRTCRVCGRTDGAPLGHEWQAATCTAPSTCVRCGETRGEPLGHSPTEADYWSPSVCTVCGAELGPRLPGDFEKYGLVCAGEYGTAYPIDCGTRNPEVNVTGLAEVSGFAVLPALEDYDVGNGMCWNFQEKEGYAWRVLSLRVDIDDEAAARWGVGVRYCVEDYYDIRLRADTTVYDPEPYDYGSRAEFQLDYRGETWTCNAIAYDYFDAWVENATTYHLTLALRVPADYDGCVFGIGFPFYGWEEGEYINDVADENTVFFRLA